jgi:ribonucleoside-diphosphate reductase alpha chain
VPLKVLCDKFSHTRFEPSGFTGNPDIPIAKSIADYIFRWLALKFLPSEEGAAPVRELPPGTAPAAARRPAGAAVVETRAAAAELPPAEERTTHTTQADAPPCPTCGHWTVRNGACYKCPNCGTTTGCS